jgi:hypothetical protein
MSLWSRPAACGSGTIFVVWMSRVAGAAALALVAGGCDYVVGLEPIAPATDGSTIDLGCANRPALLCADFEEGTTFYTDRVPKDIPLAVGNVTAAVEANAGIGHALFVDSTGDTYRLEAISTTAATRITATFDLELAHFDATAPAMSLVVLYFEQTTVSQCYVALDYQPSPPRLALAENCTSQQPADLGVALPSRTQFASFTFTMDLGAKQATAQLGDITATVPVDPGAPTTTFPGVVFGLVDPLAGSTAGVGFDNLVVVAAP